MNAEGDSGKGYVGFESGAMLYNAKRELGKYIKEISLKLVGW